MEFRKHFGFLVCGRHCAAMADTLHSDASGCPGADKSNRVQIGLKLWTRNAPKQRHVFNPNHNKSAIFHNSQLPIISSRIRHSALFTYVVFVF